MNAGREFDHVVAFMVMGYETFRDGWCDCANGRPIAPACGYQVDKKLGAAPHTWAVPFFSTSIGAAWEVVKAMESHEFKFNWLFRQEGGKSMAGLNSTLGKVAPMAHQSDDMAYSICRAACKALNVPLESPKLIREYSALEIPKP